MENDAASAAAAPARERILATASRLFHRDGYRAVGVDTIIEQSGVAKMTLYRHFPSKDELIVAHLERANDGFWEWFDSAVAGSAPARDRLVAVFDAIQRLATHTSCLGCTFQEVAAEFPDPGHPAHEVAREHKRAVLARLCQLAEEAAAPDPKLLAEQLILIMDGAFAAARMFGAQSPAGSSAGAARVLVDSALPAGPG
ncbi:MAG TPA: TetR/AcrR family transcriptional regulator [Mycobacteriales bacterium]|nr:TetR/AcrR family transcriptional regulator [Mycobacteriales bacterium]